MHKNTSYQMCGEKNKVTCYNPRANSVCVRVNMYAYVGSFKGQPLIENAYLLASNVTLQPRQEVKYALMFVEL